MDFLKKLALGTLAVTGLTLGANAQVTKAKAATDKQPVKTELPAKKTDESAVHANRVIFAHNPNKPNEIKLHYSYSRLTGKKDDSGLLQTETVLKDLYIQKEAIDANDPVKAGNSAAIQLSYLNNLGTKFVIRNQDGTTQEVTAEAEHIIYEGGSAETVKGEVLKTFKDEKTHLIKPVVHPTTTTKAPALKN